MMMMLHWAPPSPFARKVRIAAAILGLEEEIELVATDTMAPDDPIRRANPLGKIPALVLDDGPVIYDSAVILELLDHRAGGGRILPAPGDARFTVLTEQCLADGLMEAAVLKVYEGRFRDEAMRVQRWLDYQTGKVERALAHFERRPPSRQPGIERSVGEITLACALGYLDLRFPGSWRDGHPRLVDWLEGFAAAVPAFERTRFAG